MAKTYDYEAALGNQIQYSNELTRRLIRAGRIIRELQEQVAALHDALQMVRDDEIRAAVREMQRRTEPAQWTN